MNEATQLFRQSYGRGLVIFWYGLVWLGASARPACWPPINISAGNSILTILTLATGTSALTGAMGGAAAMLQRLARSLATAADFQRQSLLAYLLLPLTGLLAGVASLFIVVVPTSLLINYAATNTISLSDLSTSSTTVALQLLWPDCWLLPTRGLAKLRSAAPASFPTEPDDSERYEPGPDPGTQRQLDSILPPQFNTTAGPAEAPFAFKVWFEQRQEIIRWSARWGMFIFFYGLVWLLGLGATLLRSGPFFEARMTSSLPVVSLMATAWVTKHRRSWRVMGMYNYLPASLSKIFTINT
jgi:hypothetical protein